MDAIEKRARELVEMAASARHYGIDYHEERMIRESDVLAVIISALTPPEGHVVVTRNEAGQAVAVTRQDDEGRILSVIAEFEHHPSVPVATLAALADRWASDRNYTGSPVDDIRALIDEPTDARPEVP